MDTSPTRYARIKNGLLFLPRFFWYLLSLPIWSPVLWRIPNHIHRADWNRLLASAQLLHRMGFQTESTWFWHALAYANLSQWANALYHFERVVKSLDPMDTDAYRLCWHAYVLAKLGRFTEAQDLFRHTNISSWPEHRQVWANEFLKSISGGNDGTLVERPN
jgi:tetratricopeptide (TPR) repeat protein